MTEGQRPKRHPFQISLRTLLLLVTLASAGFGWLGHKVRLKQRERAAVEAVRNTGGAAYYRHELDADGRFVDHPQPPGPEWLRQWLGDDLFAVPEMAGVGSRAEDSDLRHLAALDQITLLNLMDTPLTDAGLIHLHATPRLEYLFLSEHVTDAGLVHLQHLSRLKALGLKGSRVSDEGLIRVAAFAEIEDLNLDSTQVTDAGLAHLKSLTKLRTLFLGGTKVTDAAIVHLKGVAQLEELHLKNTKITDAGCAKLMEAMPNLGIFR